MSVERYTVEDQGASASGIDRSGCMSTIAAFAGAWLTLTLITGFVGTSAAAWFAGGFLVCAVIAFWEAGKARRLQPKPEDHP